MKSNGEEAPIPWPIWSFWSLPNEIILSCLALIPNSYCPKLSLFSKSFHSFIFSNDLAKARHHLNTKEKCVFLFLKLLTRYLPYWSSLYTGNLLVPIPSSSYIPKLPLFYTTIGSEFYLFDGRTSNPSSVLFVSKTLNNRKWRKTPSMKVARMNTLVMKDLHEKIYVMGGCDPDESTHWAEVFDIKTQTWEPLPDPGPELRFSSLKRMHVSEGKLHVMTDKKPSVYDPERKWDITETWLNPKYTIEDVTYGCFNKKCEWFDSKLQVWIEVKGLDMLDTYDKKDCIKIAIYGWKLIMFWENPNERIWCAVTTLERRVGEIWGQIDKLNDGTKH